MPQLEIYKSSIVMEPFSGEIFTFPVFPLRSASARSHLSRPLSPPADASEEERKEWTVIPCSDFLHRSQPRPRDIEIFDFIVPFHMFTVLIDLRDRLRYQFALPPEPEPDIFPGTPRYRPMSKARAEATVTKVMGPPPPPKPVARTDPYKIKPRQLASYVSTTTGMKVRLPYELCRIMLGTDSQELLINDMKVRREVVEAILQCRLHEEEGVFMEGIIFETREVKVQKEMEKAKEQLRAQDREEMKRLRDEKRTRNMGILNSSSSTSASTANTTSSSNSNLATTPVKAESSPTDNSTNIPTPEPPPPKLTYTRSAPSKIVEVDTDPPSPPEPAKSPTDSLSLNPFQGYEPNAIADMVQDYLRWKLREPIIVEESLVRLLFGMPERGRTLKVGGASGWGRYGRSVKMRFDYFLE